MKKVPPKSVINMDPKFLKCTNSRFPGKTFIMHTQNPKFLAEVISEKDKELMIKFIDTFGNKKLKIFGIEPNSLKKQTERWIRDEIISSDDD